MSTPTLSQTPAAPPALPTADLTWDMLKELGTYERHFNNLEVEYRKLASVWLLAGFGALGFMMKEDLKMVVPREVAVMAIGFATSIGIWLLWIVDVLVYHRLLDACYVEGREIERSHPEMPQLRTQMGRYQKSGTVIAKIRWFYLLLAYAPLAFSAPFFLRWCADHGASALSSARFLLVLYAVVLAVTIMRWPRLSEINTARSPRAAP